MKTKLNCGIITVQKSLSNTAKNPLTVINADNKMITRGAIGRRIWIYQIIESTTDSTDNNSYTDLFQCYRVGIKFYYRNIITAAKWDVFLLGGCNFVNTFCYLHYSFKQTTSACYFSIHQVNHSSDICRMNSRNLVLPNWIYLLFNAFTIFTQDLNTLL